MESTTKRLLTEIDGYSLAPAFSADGGKSKDKNEAGEGRGPLDYLKDHTNPYTRS